MFIARPQRLCFQLRTERHVIAPNISLLRSLLQGLCRPANLNIPELAPDQSTPISVHPRTNLNPEGMHENGPRFQL